MDLEEQFNFTNKLKHPTNTSKVVYRFYSQDQADYFTELLVDAQIEFEAQMDDEDVRKPIYFGVSRGVETKVDRLNYLTIGKFREKFIAAPSMRWIIMVIAFAVLLLAIVGALFNS